jgi:ribosome recycling factor
MNETADLLKDKEISEDMNEVNEENVEAMIKKANTRIDDMVKEKSDDVLKM